MGFFQRRSIKIYTKNKKGLPALESSVIDVQAQPDPLSKPDTSQYGIDSVINLMRKLPQGDLDTVVSVLKHTLDSVDVDLSHIIEDADDKVESINDRLTELQAEIKQYQIDIKTREEEITNLESDLAETLDVKKDLVYAEKITHSKKGPGNKTVDEANISYSDLNTESEPVVTEEEVHIDEQLESPLAVADIPSDLAEEQNSEPFIAREAETSEQLLEFHDEATDGISPQINYEEDDGIPVVEAINLEEHQVLPEEQSASEIFEDTLKKTKSKLDQAV